MFWFALNGSLVLIGLLAVVTVFDPDIGTRVLLLCPLILAADITIGTLQMGNLQLVVFSIAMLAMVFFAKGHHAAGGALLAFMTVSKMFPGILLVYLVVRRQWRAVGWTAAFCAALVGVSFLDTGRVVYAAFVHHLPRLLSGEAFGAFRNAGGVAVNLSVPGFLYKLKLFGLPNGSFALMKAVGTIYTLVLLGATVLIARREWGRNKQAIIWLSILLLGALRSPFLPNYGVFAALWLLVLIAATFAPTVRMLSLMFIAWVLLQIPLQAFNGPDPRQLAAKALIPQATMLVLLAIALRYRPSAPLIQHAAATS
jgi:hypothetical protein